MSHPGVFRHVYGAVMHIVIKTGSEARADIVSQLCTDIDESELISARDEIFKVACESFADRNMSGVELEMKARKGKNATVSIAGDIHDLYSYVNFPDTVFPKETLKQSSRLLDVDNVDAQRLAQEHGGSGSNVNVSIEQSLPSDAYLVILKNEVSDLSKEVNNLKSELKIVKDQYALDQTKWSSKLDDLLSQLVARGILGDQHDKVLPPPTNLTDNTHRDIAQQNDQCDRVPKVQPSLTFPDRPAVTTEHSQRNGGACSDARPATAGNSLRTQPGGASSDARPSTAAPSSTQGPSNVAHSTALVLGNGTLADRGLLNGDAPNLSYSETLRSEGPWIDARPKRKPSIRAQNNPSHALTGIKKEELSYVYLRNVYVEIGDTENELKKMIKDYAFTKNVRVMNVHIKYNNYVDDNVGCKISIPANNVEKVCSDGFWPDNISCRRWVNYGRRQQPRNDRNDRNTRDRQTNNDYQRDVYERDEHNNTYDRYE